MSEYSEIEKDKINLQIWEKTIDVQMHFNDLCLRIRNFAVSILGVLLSGTALAFKFGGKFQICNLEVNTAAIFLLISVFVWFSFYFMDRFWYHELLKGAVHHGREVEGLLKSEFPSIALTEAIRSKSHASLSMKAATKLKIFYWAIGIIQIIAFIIVIYKS